MKQKHYIAGLYYRLSQEDERQGESVSIDNQRTILRKYAEEHGFEIHDEHIDDGVSGTTFQRPEVQRLLDDAKTGVINTIIVKDLSRFGYSVLKVEKERGTMDGERERKKYYLANGKIYANRFSTDCFSDYFNDLAAKSKTGLMDYMEYATEKASVEELKMQNSYFINSLYGR